MKAAFASVLAGFQGLGWDESRERPVDRLTAIAAIQQASAHRCANTAHMCSMGKDLVAFKFAHRARSRDAAVEALAACLKAKKGLDLSDVNRWRIASHAVHEWAVDICNGCLGAQKVPDHDIPNHEGPQPMKPCPMCHGTGRRRYTDQERIQAMGETFDRAMYEAHSMIAQAEALAMDLGARMVGRW